MAYKTPEKKVQDKILSYLKKLKNEGSPIFYERRQAGGYSYKKGIPDIYCVYDSYHIEIEVKASNGKLSTMQEKVRDELLYSNSFYICASNFEEFLYFFNDILEQISNHK